jgi:hypothetical protein
MARMLNKQCRALSEKPAYAGFFYEGTFYGEGTLYRDMSEAYIPETGK